MSYQFLDANSSVLTADSSIVSGVIQRPVINIASILTPIQTTISGNASVSGTVGASIIGLAPVTIIGSPSISGAVTVIGNPSVSGQVGASVIGAVPVTQSGNWNPSVSGTVGASIIGTAPVTQSGAWSTSVVGSPNISSIAGAVTLYAQPDSYVYGASSVVTGTTAASVLAAPGANLRNYITHIKITNAAAAGAIVDIKDTGGVVLDTGYAAASGGGWVSTYPTPLKQPTLNASVDVVPRSQASILATISGFKAA